MIPWPCSGRRMEWDWAVCNEQGRERWLQMTWVAEWVRLRQLVEVVGLKPEYSMAELGRQAERDLVGFERTRTAVAEAGNPCQDEKHPCQIEEHPFQDMACPFRDEVWGRPCQAEEVALHQGEVAKGRVGRAYRSAEKAGKAVLEDVAVELMRP